MHQWFTDILRFQHLCNILVIVNIIQQKFFHVKAIYHISQFMLIAKETCRNLTDLDSLSCFPEKLHGKRSFLLSGILNIRLQQGNRRFFHLIDQAARIHISCALRKRSLRKLCFLSVCNTDDLHCSIRNPGHHIKFKSIIIFFNQNFIQICKLCGFTNTPCKLLLIFNDKNSS